MTSTAGSAAFSEAPVNRNPFAEDQLPAPPFPDEAKSVAWTTLEAHFAWYNRQARRCRTAYHALKVLQLLLAASVPVAAALAAPVGVTAVLGAAIVVLEGVQQLFQLHSNWISYRATAESLRREALLYSTPADPYVDATTRQQLLAQRLALVISDENAGWAGAQRSAAAVPRSPA
jgi:hypothetical protein